MPTAERTTEPAGPSATSDEELAFPPAIRERHLFRPHYGGVRTAIGDNAFTFDLAEGSATITKLRLS